MSFEAILIERVRREARGCDERLTRPKLSLRTTLGLNLRRLRCERGVHQEWLARRTGLELTIVRGVEEGAHNASVDEIERLADQLRVEPQHLLRQQG